MLGTNQETIRKILFEIIQNQMKALDPPETKTTYDRLISQGYSEEETMKYLSSVVVTEIFSVLQQGKPFDQARYVKALKALPTLPK